VLYVLSLSIMSPLNLILLCVMHAGAVVSLVLYLPCLSIICLLNLILQSCVIVWCRPSALRLISIDGFFAPIG
jgi:hypothetical protein